MKIRTNYVSNSSSSSFVLAFKDEDGDKFFEKFANWKGYDTFIKDYNLAKNCKKKNMKFLKNDIYQLCFCLVYFVLHDDRCYWEASYENTFTGSKLLLHQKLIDQIREVVKNNTKEKKYSTGTFPDLSDNGWDLINKIVDQTYKKLVREMIKEYKIFTVLEYADDEILGAYMEHRFMPFLLENPESNKDREKHHLVRISCH